MNLGELSVRNNRVVFLAMILIVIGGAVAYRNLGRLEDPEFTIKAGNSVKGRHVAKFLSQRLGMDLFASKPED
jgi:hypothetical protein